MKKMHKQNLNMFNTAVYIRLSREDGDKEESDSVGNQRKLLIDYIEKSEELILHNIYVDDGYTGTNFNRPDFKKMIDDIEAGRVNCVIVKDLSRFGRDYIDTGRYLERIFPEFGIRFISIIDGIDSMKQAYDMLLPIKNIFNEQYARDISKKVQTAVKAKQKSGEFVGAFTSYGYKKSPSDKNKIIIDEYAADIIRRIFSLYIQGHGKQKIAKMLNAEGILCPAEYKKVNGENYKNGKRLTSTTYWSYSTVDSILHKEMYIGNMVQGTRTQNMRSKQKKVDKDKWIIVENTHEAVIDKQIWEKAQSLLKKRTRELDLETNKSIFAGFVKCGDCGRAMVKSIWQKSDNSRVYYFYCGTYKRNGKEFCTPHSLPMNDLEEIVLNDLRIIIQNISNLQELVKSQSLTASKKRVSNETESDKIKSELHRIKKLKKTVYEDYKEGIINKDEFLSYREDYTKKEDLYSKQIESLEKKKNETVEDVFEMPWLKRLLELKDISKLDRDILVEMINQITVYEESKIKISYNFSDELQHLFSGVYNTVL